MGWAASNRALTYVVKQAHRSSFAPLLGGVSFAATVTMSLPVLRIHHLGWNLLIKSYPDLALTQAWRQATVFLAQYGTFAIFAVMALPLPVPNLPCWRSLESTACRFSTSPWQFSRASSSSTSCMPISPCGFLDSFSAWRIAATNETPHREWGQVQRSAELSSFRRKPIS